MKKVLFTLYKSQCHSLYKNFTDNPPSGFRYYFLDDIFKENIFQKHGNIFWELLAKIKRNFQIINKAKAAHIDLIYCCDGTWLLNSPIPWILELEHATSIVSHNFKIWKYFKPIIPIILNQSNLKYIIPWTNAGKESLINNLELNKETQRKIKPVLLCLKSVNKHYVERNNKKFTILFVTSINYNTENEFYSKGGRILIKIYKKLRQKYNIKLIIRSKLPIEFKYLKNDRNINIYEKPLSKKLFIKLFTSSNLLLYPGYQSPGMLFLDAMNYSLPIITTDIFSNQEMVKNNINGYLTKFPKSSNVNFLLNKYGIKGIPIGIKSQEDKISKNLIDNICQKIVIIYKDKKLRNEFGKNSFNQLHYNYCLSHRNTLLKKLYNLSLK